MNLTMKLPNGEEITGDVLEWIAMIVNTLPKEQRDAVCKGIQAKRVFVRTPGSHVLKAEPGILGVLSKKFQ